MGPHNRQPSLSRAQKRVQNGGQNKASTARFLWGACVAASLLAAPSGRAQAPSSGNAPPPSSAFEALIKNAPKMPSDAELKALSDADPRFARPLLRRAARTSPDPRQRAFALKILGTRDPSRASASICARALRLDPAASVRRAAAECLGRIPGRFSAPQTPALLTALHDPSLDVLNMVGWALANVGDPEALGPVAALVNHKDKRVGAHFYAYAKRLRARHQLTFDGEVMANRHGSSRGHLVPRPSSLVQISGLEASASTAWVGIYGAMAGWLHGGYFTAAYGGSSAEGLSALTALGGAVTGLAVGGAYAYSRNIDLAKAHNLVQMGTMGTFIGFGAGLLSDVAPISGVNTAALGLLGTISGTGVGVLMNETLQPTPGAMAAGLAMGLGAGVSGFAFMGGFNLPSQNQWGGALFAGGLVGGVSTALLAPYQIGLLPTLGASLGGITGAASMALLMGAIELSQLNGAPVPFTEGAGFSVAAGYAGGAAVGGTLALLIPVRFDPLLADGLTLTPPTLSLLRDWQNPNKTAPIVVMGGTF